MFMKKIPNFIKKDVILKLYYFSKRFSWIKKIKRIKLELKLILFVYIFYSKTTKNRKITYGRLIISSNFGITDEDRSLSYVADIYTRRWMKFYLCYS